MALAVGPVAILALMTASALQPLSLSGAAYGAAALSLTLLVGLLLALLAVLRLGFLANFLSHPVIAGFVSGSALLIAVSQVRHLLGVAAEGHNLPQLLPALWSQLPVIHVHTALPGDPSRVDPQFISLLDMVVQHSRQQIVGSSDSVHITGEVKVDVLHRHHLCVAAACGSALDAEDRS